MKKKLLFMMLGVFLLTGCTATYELDIQENRVQEKVSVNQVDIDEETKEIYVTNAMPVDYRETCYLDYDRVVGINEVKKKKGGNYYNIKETSSGLNATSKIPISDYQYSRLASMAFSSIHVNNYEHYISIYGYDGVDIFNQYPTLESFSVRITTDKEVLETDADEVDGNTYIWNFTPEDTDKTLYIEMDSTQVTKNKKKKQKEHDLNMTALIIFGTIGTVAVIFILYVALKRKRVNKI